MTEARVWLEEVAEELSRLAGVHWMVVEAGHQETGFFELRRVRLDGGALLVRPPGSYSERRKVATHLEFSALWPTDPQTGSTLTPMVRRDRDWSYLRIARRVALSKRPTTAAKEVHRHVVVPYEAPYSEQWGCVQKVVRALRRNAELVEKLRQMGANPLGRMSRGDHDRVNVAGVLFKIGKDSVSLHDGNLDHDTALAVARALLGRTEA